MFYLYDPREFAVGLAEMKNVQLFREYFTDEIAAKYRGCLFISDIRTSEKQGENFEDEVAKNLSGLAVATIKYWVLNSSMPSSSLGY